MTGLCCLLCQFFKYIIHFYGEAELLQVDVFSLIQLFARDILLMKKLEMEETKTTKYSTFKTDIIKVGLVFMIFNFFING